MKLSEIQSLFKRNLMIPEADPRELHNLSPVGKLTLEQAFQIYHRGYINRLTQSLKGTFEAVAWVLGEALFAELCRHYIEAQPSVSYNLSVYGETFPGFIKDSATTKGIPFLSDLARFEWTYKEVLEAPTPEPLPIEQIRELLSQEDVHIGMIEGMRVFSSDYSVQDIWKCRKDPAYMFEDINWSVPEHLLIYKKQQRVLTQRLSKAEAVILQELQEGASLAEAFSHHANELSPEKITSLIEMMMRNGIIADVTPAESY